MLNRTIIIPEGSLSASIFLASIDDILNEFDETVVIDIDTVTNGIEAGLPAGQQVTVTIIDDDLQPTITLSIIKTGTGSGTITSSPDGINCGTDCSEMYISDTVVTLTATPGVGSLFSGWSGACVGGEFSDNVTMTADKSCTAAFTVTDTTFTLTVTGAGSGTGGVTATGIDCGVDCSEAYLSGTVVTLTATPDTGSLFSGWSGNCVGDASQTFVTMIVDKSCTATFNLVPPPPQIGEAVDNTSLTWITGGDADWFEQTATSFFGGDAAQSGNISNNATSSVETTVIGPGTVTFYWKVSSEEDYDFLRFYIDGVEQSGRISGEVDWEQKTYLIGSGSHTLRWAYTKDECCIVGSDAGWLDNVVFTTTP